MTGPVAGDLGPCEVAWCFRTAVVYVSGPTLGPSPRVLLVAGERAAQLSAARTGLDTFGNLRCVECAQHAVEDAVGHMPVGPAPAR